MLGCFMTMICLMYRTLIHKSTCFLEIYHGTFLKGQGCLERMCWCLVIYLDLMVKYSTIVISAFVLAEAFNFRDLLGKITAIWFLDQID